MARARFRSSASPHASHRRDGPAKKGEIDRLSQDRATLELKVRCHTRISGDEDDQGRTPAVLQHAHEGEAVGGACRHVEVEAIESNASPASIAESNSLGQSIPHKLLEARMRKRFARGFTMHAPG
jgi:hypothetical protein